VFEKESNPVAFRLGVLRTPDCADAEMDELISGLGPIALAPGVRLELVLRALV
jgi:hypothetical protein